MVRKKKPAAAPSRRGTGLRGKRQSGSPTHIGRAAKSIKEKIDDTVLVDEDKIGNATQRRIPGTERRTNARIEKKALEVYELQQERIDKAKEEQAARAELTELMRELNVDQQDLPDDLEAELDLSPKAKVHKKKKAKKDKKKDITAPEGGDAATES